MPQVLGRLCQKWPSLTRTHPSSRPPGPDAGDIILTELGFEFEPVAAHRHAPLYLGRRSSGLDRKEFEFMKAARLCVSLLRPFPPCHHQNLTLSMMPLHVRQQPHLVFWHKMLQDAAPRLAAVMSGTKLTKAMKLSEIIHRLQIDDPVDGVLVVTLHLLFRAWQKNCQKYTFASEEIFFVV